MAMAMVCNNIQSSSSSSWMTRKYYDVFVSFRGKDIRYSFISNLFGAFQRKGVVAFRDDTKLKKGEPIAPELLQAIEGSQLFIVVFSMNYASSTWCLRELAKILDCVQVLEKRVLPIFYDVDPSVVQKQSGDYEKAFAEYEETFKDDLEKMVEVKRWREALTQVANLSGLDINNKPQWEEIEKIVGVITSILGHNFSSLPFDIVGMQSPLEELEKLLLLNSVNDVRVVGICGMGGIGKTTLAAALYYRISHQFDARCFIHDVSRTYKKYGAIGIQEQLLNQNLNDKNVEINNLYNTTNLIRSRLSHARAFIVLDNVDQVEQLDKKALNLEWLGAGSRIILISRDELILNEYGVNEVYKIPLLNWDYSVQLFCIKAFNCGNIMTDYEELTHDVVSYANGLPLAIKVLASFLFDRDVSEWKSALGRLRDNPSKDIMDVLRLSFDGLQEMEKEIFLDIACFFNGEKELHVKNVLNCCGFHADIGIKFLIEKSLISIKYYDTIEVHDLLEQLGMKIVQENPTKEARKWSRLWYHGQFYNVMSENMVENVEAIVLSRSVPKETEMLMMAETLQQMRHLRLLIIHGANFSRSLNCLSNELRYFKWDIYPFMYLPSNFQPNQLVKLSLKHSNVKQLWEGKKHLPNLRKLDLRHSKNLIKMPNFGEISNLERLNLEGCVKLMQLDPSIGLLERLIFLNLKNCKSLVSIPNNILALTSLEYLNLSGCSNVSILSMDAKNWEKLDTSETTLQSQSLFSIFKWIKSPFHFLYPRVQKDSGSTSCLLPSLPSSSCLHELDISFCNVSQIPDVVGSLHCLERLNLGGNNFVRLPSLKELSRLVYLNLEHCKRLKSLPELALPINLQLRRQLPSHPLYRRLHRAGIYIFNCPKLGERELCGSIIISWMKQLIQANQESFSPFDAIDIVIPGSEIPSWFHNQNVGSSIRIDLSRIFHKNNCIGLACCMVFDAYNAPTPWSNEMEPIIEIGFAREMLRRFARIPVLLDRDLITVKSDHRWLIYFPRKSFMDEMGPMYPEMHELGGVKLKIFSKDGRGLCIEVKNCGYRWIYKQDPQLVNVTMMHSGDMSARKRKFFTMEDEALTQP